MKKFTALFIFTLLISTLLFSCSKEDDSDAKSVGAASRAATMTGDYPIFKAFGKWYTTPPDDTTATEGAAAADAEKEEEQAVRSTFLINFFNEQITLLEKQNNAVKAMDDDELKRLLTVDADQYFDLVATVLNPEVDRSSHPEKDLWASAIVEFYKGGAENQAQHKLDFKGFFDDVSSLDTDYAKLQKEFELFKPEMIKAAMADKDTLVENNEVLMNKLTEMVATLEQGGVAASLLSADCGVFCSIWNGVGSLIGGVFHVGFAVLKGTFWVVTKVVQGGVWVVKKAVGADD